MSTNEKFGSAIDLSTSGNFLIVGAPGGGENGMGLSTIYQYSSLNWFVVSTVSGEQINEAMGSSVHMLSSDGFVVAVGGPGYDTNRGRVVVYERNALTGRYDILGTPIVGDVGERIGVPNTLSGTSNLSKSIITVIARTDTGLVKRYEFNKSSLVWTITVIVQSTTDLQSIASTSDSSILVVSSGSTATIYEL
jgi:hypothetical protein